MSEAQEVILDDRLTRDAVFRRLFGGGRQHVPVLFLGSVGTGKTGGARALAAVPLEERPREYHYNNTLCAVIPDGWPQPGSRLWYDTSHVLEAHHPHFRGSPHELAALRQFLRGPPHELAVLHALLGGVPHDNLFVFSTSAGRLLNGGWPGKTTVEFVAAVFAPPEVCDHVLENGVLVLSSYSMDRSCHHFISRMVPPEVDVLVRERTRALYDGDKSLLYRFVTGWRRQRVTMWGELDLTHLVQAGRDLLTVSSSRDLSDLLVAVEEEDSEA